MSDYSPSGHDKQSGEPFGEHLFRVPYDEEIRAWATEVLQEHQDAVRHYVEFLLWGIFDRPELVKIAIALFWHWEDVEPKWMAEACYMQVSNICEIAEAQQLRTFECLDCGVELPVRNRRDAIHRHRCYKAYLSGETEGRPTGLLCAICMKQREEQEKAQQSLDQRRHRALLSEQRSKPYEVRRESEEWAVIKRQVHRRDGYRCRLCNRDDRPLHVHHRTYSTYVEERMEDLITLCANCHGLFHSLSKVS